MSNLKATNKSKPCPVCGTTSNACREQTDGDQELWHCRTYSDASKGEKIAGVDGRRYICLSPLRGHTAMFGVDKGVWSAEEKEEYQRRQLDRRVESDRRRAEALAKEMSAGDRDKYFKKVLGELGLLESDRQNLLDRGFTDNQIEAIGFRSLIPQQPLTGNYPHNLPGYQFGFGAGKLQNSGAGILCPIPDWQGNIVGAQIRLSKVGEGDGRYRWLSSKNNSSHLNGENPIACWDKAEDKVDKIWLAEGTGIKPALASLRLGAPVVGAAGGLFASSPKNTEAALAHLSQKYGTRSLVLAADAGDVVNPQVMNRWRIQVSFLEKLGYTVAFAWWGQVSKESDDIDELANFDGIRYISPDEFWAIADKPKVIAEVQSSDASSDTELGAWIEGKKFTADDKFSSKYYEYRAPNQGEILLGKSPTGTGKTEYVARLFKEGGEFANKKLIGFFSRNSLIVNTCKRINGLFQLSDERAMMVKDPTGKVGLCTNSIKKFSNPEWFDDAVIFVDELESVMSHILVSSTHKKDRVEALNLLREAFSRAYCVIGMDANLTDRAADWVQTLAPQKRVTKVENTFKQLRANVELFAGTPRKSGKLNSKKISPLVGAMLSSTKPFLVLSDSQIKLEQIEKILVENGKTGIRIDSKTLKPDSEEKHCLADVNDYIRERVKEGKPIDYFLGSPSLGVGVDINVPGYFSDSYVLLSGVLGTDDAMQLAGRCRDTGTLWHISTPEKSFLPSKNFIGFDNFDVAKMSQRLIEFSRMDISHLKKQTSKLAEEFSQWIEEARSNSDSHFALMLLGKDAYEKRNLKRCLKYALETAGHSIKEVSDIENQRIEALLELSKEEIKERTAQEIFEAPDITEEEAEQLSRSYTSTWEERLQIKKAAIRRLCPGLDETEFWTQDLFYYLEWENTRAISQANLLYLFNNPEVATKKQVNTWARIAADRKLFLPDLNSDKMRVEALRFLKLEQFLDPDKQWHKNSPEILELVKKGSKQTVQINLGKVPKNKLGEADGIKYLSKLLEMVGLKLGKASLLPRVEGQPRVRVYGLDAKTLHSPLRLAITEAVERRYQEFDREWVLPEVLQVPVQQPAVEEEQPVIEPETDADGIDWRGVTVELKEAFGGFMAGARLELVTQPQQIGDRLMVWARSVSGQIRVEWDLLSLCFD